MIPHGQRLALSLAGRRLLFAVLCVPVALVGALHGLAVGLWRRFTVDRRERARVRIALDELDRIRKGEPDDCPVFDGHSSCTCGRHEPEPLAPPRGPRRLERRPTHLQHRKTGQILSLEWEKDRREFPGLTGKALRNARKAKRRESSG